MAIGEKTVSIGTTSYIVRLDNVRKYTVGVAAVDVSVKRVGDSEIIGESVVDIQTTPPSGVRQTLDDPPEGRFRKNTVYFAHEASNVSVTWTGVYGTETITAEFEFDGPSGRSVGLCDYTNPDGSIPNTIGGVPASDAVDAVGKAFPMSQQEVTTLFNAFVEGNTVDQCTGGGDRRPQQQGISPAVIGLGVLGAGAVAVALSQRDE